MSDQVRVCDYVELDGSTYGCCHLVGTHGGRCVGCRQQASDCEHVRAAIDCPYPTCASHNGGSEA